MRYEIQFHEERCVGCQTCVIACMEEKNMDIPLCRIWEQELEQGSRLISWRRQSCLHCSEPVCESICPAGGFYKDPKTGFVLQDQKNCVFCGQCLDACREQAIFFDKESHVQKCDGCRKRVLEGKEPACVTVCPWGALELIKKEEEN